MPPTERAILTGTPADGTGYDVADDRITACDGWASNAISSAAVVGHADSTVTEASTDRWNNAPETVRCSAADIKAGAGAGRIYCFLP